MGTVGSRTGRNSTAYAGRRSFFRSSMYRESRRRFFNCGSVLLTQVRRSATSCYSRDSLEAPQGRACCA